LVGRREERSEQFSIGFRHGLGYAAWFRDPTTCE
jgi:hypothetical protein